jgi:hypothetical protein
MVVEEKATAPGTDTFVDEDDKNNTKTPSGTKPRQYVIDRTNGKSKIDPTKKPPLPCCFVPPCVRFLPTCLEQNVVCVTMGKVGCVPTESAKMRRILFAFGIFANLISFALTIFGMMASSEDFGRLQTTSFSSGTVTVYDIATNEVAEEITMDIGLRAVAFDNPNTVGQQVYNFDEFCDLTDLAGRYLNEDQCSSCSDSSAGLMTTLVISLITIFPVIFTDVLRMYSNYDLNCQKFFGSLVSTFALIMTLSTILAYENSCFESFYDGNVYFDADSNALDDENGATYLADFDWEAGNGLICLYLATFIKLIDIIANILVPTPTITRNRKEQEEYEALSGEE